MAQALTSRNVEIVTRPPRDIEALVKGWVAYAGNAFPVTIRGDKLERAAIRLKVAILASAKPADLASCSPESIGKCIALSAMTELYPGPGEMRPDVWLIPRAGQLCWQMGASSYKRLARRAGFELRPRLVYKGERCRFVEGTSPEIHHEVNVVGAKGWDNIVWGYVIITELATGGREILSMTRAQIEQRRKCAQAQNVWRDWPDEMALKTLCNYAGQREAFPLDEVTRYALAADNEMSDPVISAKVETEAKALSAGTEVLALPPRTAAEPVPTEVEEPEPVTVVEAKMATAEQVAELKRHAGALGVSFDGMEGEYRTENGWTLGALNECRAAIDAAAKRKGGKR